MEDIMLDATILFTITPLPLVSVLVWVLLGVAAMYLARRSFHQALESLARLIYNAMRLSAASVKMSRQRLETRNREVLLTAGIEHAERRTERELERISTRVQRSLAAHPPLQRQLRENLLKLEDDYQKSAEIPQGLSDWVKVIDAIAGIKPVGDPMVATILEDIHNTLKEQHKVALEGHRKAASTRHSILSRMVPQWNSTEKILNRLETSISELTNRSFAVDRSMEAYEAIHCRVDAAERRLLSSSLTQFFTSSLVLGIFTIGIIINFNLVALPMAEMVGGHSYIGAFKTSDVAGMFIVCLQIVLGMVLMDASKITRFFSVIGCLDDKQRAWLFWGLLGMLTILAGLESSLAFLRDRIAVDMEALRQSLAGIDPSVAAASNIPVIGQMILGFMLPFILTTAAIPAESFIRSSRTVLGRVMVWTLYLLAFLLRLTGSVGYYGARLVVRLYDLIIFPAIWLEALIQRKLETAKLASKGGTRRPMEKQSALNMLKETVQCKNTHD
jgi:hypothetical protein